MALIDDMLKGTRKRMLDCIDRFYEDTDDVGAGNLDRDGLFVQVVEEYIKTDWKRKAINSLMNGDQATMVKEILPVVQYRMAEAAIESEDEKTRVDACKFLLSQGGVGPVQKHKHEVDDYRRMPEDQLMTLIASKLEEIKKFNPTFDVSKLLLHHNDTIEVPISDDSDTEPVSQFDTPV